MRRQRRTQKKVNKITIAFMAIAIVSRYLFTAFLYPLSFAIEMENLFPLRKTHPKRNDSRTLSCVQRQRHKETIEKLISILSFLSHPDSDRNWVRHCCWMREILNDLIRTGRECAWVCAQLKNESWIACNDDDDAVDRGLQVGRVR